MIVRLIVDGTMIVLFVVLVGMLGVMVLVMLDFGIEVDFFIGYAGYMDAKDKPEFIKLIGLGIGGIIATFSVVGLLRRAASGDEQNILTEKGHVHERFKAATEHLGNEKSVSARVASFNEFYHIVEIEPGFRKTIFDILCAHLRQTTKDKNYKSHLKPTEEVQNLLDILFKPKNKDILIFEELKVNLAEAHLRYANLEKANLRYANLEEANLQEANLQGANLEKAKMQEANLQEAKMQEANLQEANLQGANLRYANMEEANLEKANLEKAKMREANLQEANLQEAKMQEAKMQEANLQGANLQGANLQEANLQEANLQGSNLQGSNLREANLQEANLQEANLEEANLEKANLQEANLQEANLQEANLQDANLEKAKMQGANLQGTNPQRQYMKEEYLLGAEINEATAVTPDNWQDFVKLHESKDGKKN